MNTIESEPKELTLEELHLCKLAVTLATEEVRRRKQPYTELVSQFDALYQRLRDLGA